jgi:hypothetical protein
MIRLSSGMGLKAIYQVRKYTTVLTSHNMYFFAAKTVNLPFLADSINEGTVAQFLKSTCIDIVRARIMG